MIDNEKSDILIGKTPLLSQMNAPRGNYVELMGETYYRISHYDQMPPFFMSLVSASDHWLFIASNGGLTAGRIDADSALFPYETEDKIVAHSEQTGGKTLVRLKKNGGVYLWEPFSNYFAGMYRIERHLYKNVYGNKLILEEVNQDLQLSLREAWRTSDRFGFVRTCWLMNDGDEACQIDLLDGLQNLLPYGATSALQATMSNLLHAYKRNELIRPTGLGLYSLSATLTDRAEPSESLQATVAWQTGLKEAQYLLCTDQIDDFRYGRSLAPENDIRGKAGAYLVSSRFELALAEQMKWHIVSDVNQDSAAVTKLSQFLDQDSVVIDQQIEADIVRGTNELVHYVAAADGLQLSEEQSTASHHFANVMFNIMRGGIFADGYQVKKKDFLDFVQARNKGIMGTKVEWLADLPEKLNISDLYARGTKSEDPDLIRLCYEYLPLIFSRRHGDPSRPWNRFSINLKKSDGSPNLDYQGNWRDIFQNWEPLAVSFPTYVEGLIAKFLNATTADGYNPYRVTRDGIEWEVPEPNNPWANIGYWSDHQIIYLQKLLEIAEKVRPGELGKLWNRPVFAYANVPYRLRPYQEMLVDWYNTIDFDWEMETAVAAAVSRQGTDGRLIRDHNGHVIHVTMTEKLLVLLLAKLTNLVPEGGIWMNTQRPEWNDANNALVGKGLSVVTVAYLRRFIAFWLARLDDLKAEAFEVNTAVATLFSAVHGAFTTYRQNLQLGFNNKARRMMMDELGTAATTYRQTIYQDGLPQTEASIEAKTLREFLALAQAYIEETLRTNRRPDGLAHTYNVLRLGEQSADVEHLYLMLEGQVALLSSGMLTPEEVLDLLHGLRRSDLYRADQHSYMLYPNRSLPGFLHKNNIPHDRVARSKLVEALITAGDGRLLVQDEADIFHFNGRFRNADDVSRVLDILSQESAYDELVQAERRFILELFEETFNHRAFTGRSGTFFAYEGLGSIYWHMVSKLLLAVQECYFQAVDRGAETAVAEALAAAYYDIRDGLGFNKSPAAYGAFPTDPYSHTPWGGGARQPGMTGQVKEEILTRWGELGLSLINGQLHFSPRLLRAEEFLTGPDSFNYVDVAGQNKTLPLVAGSLAFTYCQVPIVYRQGEAAQIEVIKDNGQTQTRVGSYLDTTITHHILKRDGRIQQVWVTIPRL